MPQNKKISKIARTIARIAAIKTTLSNLERSLFLYSILLETTSLSLLGNYEVREGMTKELSDLCKISTDILSGEIKTYGLTYSLKSLVSVLSESLNFSFPLSLLGRSRVSE